MADGKPQAPPLEQKCTINGCPNEFNWRDQRGRYWCTPCKQEQERLGVDTSKWKCSP